MNFKIFKSRSIAKDSRDSWATTGYQWLVSASNSDSIQIYCNRIMLINKIVNYVNPFECEIDCIPVKSKTISFLRVLVAS